MSSTSYNAPPTREIESRSCSAYDIPMDKNNNGSSSSSNNNNGTKEQQEPRIGSTSTSASETSKPSSSLSSSSASSSSVIDKEEIASRGISSSQDVTREDIQNEIDSFLQAPFQWHHERRSFLTIVMFLTRLPVPATVDLHPGFLMKGMVYFPFVGMLIGMAVATVFDMVNAGLGLPPAVAAAASVGTGWIVTGCFHEDGLSDSADGLGGGWTRAQIFKIMTDSRVGTYGCALLGLYTTTKIHLLAALGPSQHNNDYILISNGGAGPAMVVAHTVARVTSPYLIHCFDYVDDEQGPKSSFYAFMKQAKYLVSLPRVLVAVLMGGIVTSVLYNAVVAMVLLLVVLMFAHASGHYGKQMLGGVMGDYLGATICLSELLILTMLLMLQQQCTNDDGNHGQLAWNTLSEDMMAASKNLTIQSVLLWMQNFYLDPSLRSAALVRFLLFLTFRKAWIEFVNFSNNKRSDTTNTNTTTAADNINNNTETTTANEDASSPKSEALRVLARTTSSFRERHDAVQAYLDVLAKPVGSLGTLERWAARLAALQRTLTPDTTKVACLIFAGDHGVAAAPDQGGEGCSAYPQAVTQSVLVGLHRGVAGASVLTKANNVDLRVIDVGVVLGNDDDLFPNSKFVFSSPQKIATGTRNFCLEPAMSAEECEKCMEMGRDSLVQYLKETSATVVVLGEVGIGNTTSSSALIAALTQKPPQELCGGGAFATRELSETVVSKKISIVDRALQKHYGISGKKRSSVLAVDALTKLGGTEIAALVGALLEASSQDIPVLVDGFIVTAAALVAVSMSPDACRVLFFSSQSAEPGQRAAIEKIQAIARNNALPDIDHPTLSMNLRMGEATAALLAVPILQSSAKVLSEMATIQDILS